MTVVPIKDGFENVKALLHHIAADEEIVSFAMVVVRKSGHAIPVQFNCNYADIAYAGVLLTQVALDNGEDS